MCRRFRENIILRTNKVCVLQLFKSPFFAPAWAKPFSRQIWPTIGQCGSHWSRNIVHYRPIRDANECYEERERKRERSSRPLLFLAANYSVQRRRYETFERIPPLLIHLLITAIRRARARAQHLLKTKTDASFVKVLAVRLQLYSLQLKRAAVKKKEKKERRTREAKRATRLTLLFRHALPSLPVGWDPGCSDFSDFHGPFSLFPSEWVYQDSESSIVPPRYDELSPRIDWDARGETGDPWMFLASSEEPPWLSRRKHRILPNARAVREGGALDRGRINSHCFSLFPVLYLFVPLFT